MFAWRLSIQGRHLPGHATAPQFSAKSSQLRRIRSYSALRNDALPTSSDASDDTELPSRAILEEDITTSVTDSLRYAPITFSVAPPSALDNEHQENTARLHHTKNSPVSTSWDSSQLVRRVESHLLFKRFQGPYRRLLTKHRLLKLLDLHRINPRFLKRNLTLRQQRIPDEVIRTAKNSTDVYWTEVLRLFSEAPLEKKVQTGKDEAVYVSLDTLVQLTGVSTANNWVDPGRDGCHVSVQDGRFQYNKKRLILRGSVRAIELAKEQLLKAEQSLHPEVRFLGKDGVPSKTNRASNGRSCAGPQRKTYWTSTVEFHPVKEPEEWNLRTFANYVEDLAAVDLTLAPQIKRVTRKAGMIDELPSITRFGDPGTPKQLFHVISAKLDSLFSDPKLHFFVSTKAQETALNFLLRYYQLRPHDSYDLIMSVLNHGRIQIPARLWNAVLECALKEEKIGFIRSLFSFAREKQIPLTPHAGLIVLRQANSPRAKAGICQWFVDRNFLIDPKTVEDFTAEIVADLSKAFFKTGATAPALFSLLNHNVGHAWQTDLAIYRILNMCAENKFVQQAEQMLQLMRTWGTKLDQHTVALMTKVYYRCRSPTKLINFLTSDLVRAAGRDDRSIIPLAFHTAAGGGRYNTCRVLWHYAAVKGLMTYEMRDQGYHGISRNFALPNSSWVSPNRLKRSWKLKFGKVVAGVGLDAQELSVRFPMLRKDAVDRTGEENPHPMKWIVFAAREHRAEQIGLTGAIMHNDERAFIHFETDFKFSELLKEAHEMDLRWIEQRKNENDVEWLIDNAIPVPLRRREKPLDVFGFQNTREGSSLDEVPHAWADKSTPGGTKAKEDRILYTQAKIVTYD